MNAREILLSFFMLWATTHSLMLLIAGEEVYEKVVHHIEEVTLDARRLDEEEEYNPYKILS